MRCPPECVCGGLGWSTSGPGRPGPGGRLTTDAQRLLAVASVFADEVPVDDLADVLGTSVGSLLSSLGEITATGVMVSTPDAVVFRDERERQDIYEDIPEPVRRGLHRQIGRPLLERGVAVAAATHLSLATRSGDRRALSDLDRVIGELRPGAPDTAAVLATQALDLTEPADPSRFDRTVQAVEAQLAARRLDEAVDLARRTLAGGQAPPDQAARLRLAVASVELMRGEVDSSRAEAEAVLAGTARPDGPRADAEVARLFALLAGDDLTRARAPAEAILAGETGGGSEALAGALYVMGFIAWADARVADAMGFVRAAIARSEPGRRLAFPIHPAPGAGADAHCGGGVRGGGGPPGDGQGAHRGQRGQRVGGRSARRPGPQPSCCRPPGRGGGRRRGGAGCRRRVGHPDLRAAGPGHFGGRGPVPWRRGRGRAPAGRRPGRPRLAEGDLRRGLDDVGRSPTGRGLRRATGRRRLLGAGLRQVVSASAPLPGDARGRGMDVAGGDGRGQPSAGRGGGALRRPVGRGQQRVPEPRGRRRPCARRARTRRPRP